MVAAVALTGCNSDNDNEAAPGTSASITTSSGTTPTTSETPAETGGPDPTLAPTDVPTEDPVQPESTPPDREDLLIGLEEVPASGYEDRTRIARGFRFMTETGSVNCHLGSGGFACLVPEHAPWPAEQRADDGLDGMGIPKAIGWSWSVGGTPFDGVPHHWAVQGQWPSPVESGPLKEGQKIVFSGGFSGGGAYYPDFTCGVVNGSMTCATSTHGFTVSADTYDTW